MIPHRHSCSFKFNGNTLPPTPLKCVFTSKTLRPVPIYSVAFNFTCKTTVQDWISHEYSTDLVNQHPCHVTTSSFNLNLHKNVSESRLQIDIAKELPQLPIPEQYNNQIIKRVVRRTMRWIGSSKPGDNNFLINVEINHVRDRVIELETFPKMVPATEESIQSLERKKGTDYGSCSICLEDFPEDCLAARMPCSHVFHGDCIERWLKNSHCCPLCRYEMPSTSLSSSIGDLNV